MDEFEFRELRMQAKIGETLRRDDTVLKVIKDLMKRNTSKNLSVDVKPGIVIKVSRNRHYFFFHIPGICCFFIFVGLKLSLRNMVCINIIP